MKRILIVRPDRIGDVVLSTAIPREIKKNLPDSFVAVLVREYTQAVYLNNPYVDKIILLENLPEGGLQNFYSSVKEMQKYKFTHALMLLPNERINYLLFFAGIKTRVGVGRKFFQTITFTKEVSRHKYIPLRHEADYCMDLARKIGVNTNEITPEIHLTKHEKAIIIQKKRGLTGNGNLLIGIHTTSGSSAPNLKESEYFELIKKLIDVPNIKVVVTDNNISRKFSDLNDVNFINEGKQLRKSIINFAMLDLLISASTGPMHICSALNVKTLSLFCPLTACSPKLWGPLGNDNRTILPSDNYCKTQCPKDPKKCNFEGNGGIDTEKIVTEVKRLIANF